LPQLIHTPAVVHEAMRLYPPAYTLARLTIASDNAGGIPISPGAMVLICPGPISTVTKKKKSICNKLRR
jgi:cytochrome P450